MSNYKTDVLELVARCRRVGWEVDEADGRGDWWYRVYCPGQEILDIHGTPRDPAWHIARYRDRLRKAGLDEAEAEWLKRDKAEKAMKLQAEREKADAQAQRLAKLARQEEARSKAAGEPQPVDAAWIMTPASRPESRFVLMTPEVARKMLDTMNTANRAQAKSSFFADLMRTGDFKPTHQGGAVDSRGVIQDGQSRLAGIVETGQAQVMMWTVGMPPEYFAAVDNGRPRSGRDVAYVRGEERPGTISAAAKMLLAIDDYGPDAHSQHNRVSNRATEAALDRYGEPLREAVAVAHEIRRDLRKANAAAMSVAVFMLRRRMPAGDPRVMQFLTDLRLGGLERSDPVWHLRQALSNGNSGTRRAYTAWPALALTLKAWRARQTGRKLHLLVWRPREPFPCDVYLPPPAQGGRGLGNE